MNSLLSQCTALVVIPAQPFGTAVPPLHSCLCLWASCHSGRNCYSVQTFSIMEATEKRKSNDKSPEKWELLTEMFKNVGCKYSRLQVIREGFLAFLNTNEDVSRINANDVIIELNNNGFLVVVPQLIISKKKL